MQHHRTHQWHHTAATETRFSSFYEEPASSYAVQQKKQKKNSVTEETRKHPCRWRRRLAKRWQRARADTSMPSSSPPTADHLSATMRRTHKELAVKSRRFIIHSLPFTVPRRKRERRRDHTMRRRTYSAASGSSSHSGRSDHSLAADIDTDAMDRSTRQRAFYALDRQLQPYNECLVARLRFLEALPLAERSEWTELFRSADRHGAAAVSWDTAYDQYLDPHADRDGSRDGDSEGRCEDGIASLITTFTNRCTLESSSSSSSYQHRYSPALNPTTPTGHPASSARLLDALSGNYIGSVLSDHEYDGDGDEEEEVEICLNGPGGY